MADTESGYRFTPGCWGVTDAMKEDFRRDGYIIVRNLLSDEELAKLRKFLDDKKFLEHHYNRDDGEGRKATLVMWNHPGDDLTGLLARSERMVNTAEALLGGEVYHYHTKLTLKHAKTGGAWSWHQDYGYWYENGCLFPDMLTVFIAMDKADRQNGCLKVLKGSHQMGRVQHRAYEGLAKADPERVEAAEPMFPLTHVEMNSGDAIFFHCNVLHRSDKNDSDRNRYAFLCAYNRASNNPVIPHHHPQYTPLTKVADEAFMAYDTSQDVDWDSKWMAHLVTNEENTSLKRLKEKQEKNKAYSFREA